MREAERDLNGDRRRRSSASSWDFREHRSGCGVSFILSQTPSYPPHCLPLTTKPFSSAPFPLPSSQRSLFTHLEKTLLLLIPPRNPYLISYTSWQTDGKSYVWDGIVEKFHFIKQGLSCPLHLPANSLHPFQCFSTALTLFGLILYPWS